MKRKAKLITLTELGNQNIQGEKVYSKSISVQFIIKQHIRSTTSKQGGACSLELLMQGSIFRQGSSTRENMTNDGMLR